MSTGTDDGTLKSIEEVARLLGVANREGIADYYLGKRGDTRFAVSIALEVTTDPDRAASAFPASLHNISDGGFAFWSRHKVPIMTQILVREFSGDDPRPWVPACIEHCTTGIRGYLVGARIDRGAGGKS